MFSFTKEQKTIEISKIKIGGQPGVYPTVLFGGFFFSKEPDFEKERKLLLKMYELERETSLPAIPDFFIKKESQIEKIIDFVQKNLPKDKPFSVDLLSPKIKPLVLSALDDCGLLERTIYNSIHIGITKDERAALSRHTPKSAIIVAFNPRDKSIDGRIEILENSGNLLDKGLLEIAEEVGIKNILIDTAALAPEQNSGAAIASLPVIKEEYGLPSGCAIHNVVEKSLWLKKFENAKKFVDAASNINIPLFGGDFVIFGPAQNMDLVFPMIAWQDILVSEYVENYFGVEPDKNHPRRRLSRG